MGNQYKYQDKPYCITDKETAPLYSRWTSMNGRCRDTGHSKYSSYGGKGIRVCAEWRNDFDAFREWAICSGFSPSLSIDRIDPNGDYCPRNCRWISLQENRKRARFCKGSNHHKAILSEEIVIEARKRRAKGESIASMAREYGVTVKALGPAVRGTTWKHLRAIIESKVLEHE